MSLYGAGNLMMNAQLVVLFSDRLHLASLTQIVLLTVVPMLLMPLFAAVVGAAVRSRAHHRVPRAPVLGAGRRDRCC